MSLSVFFYCMYFALFSLAVALSTNPSPLWPFLLSHVAVLRPCLLLAFFPKRDLLKRLKARMWFKCFSHSHASNFFCNNEKIISDFNIYKCYKGEDVTENHTRFTVTTCGSGISLCYDYFNVFDLVRVSPILLCKKFTQKVLPQCTL